MDQKNCDVCDSRVPVKKDGSLWKHKTPEGVQCEPGTNHTVSAEPITFSANVEKKSGLVIDVAETADAVPAKPIQTASSRVYVFSMTVSVDCPYLGAPRWEAENKKLAFKRAKESGKKPNGEPRFLKSEVEGRKRTLFYEVPVE